MSVLVHINDRRYLIDNGDAAAVEEQVLAAVHEGAAFVSVTDAITGPARVLVTAASSVWFHHAATVVPSEPDAETFPDLSYLDYA